MIIDGRKLAREVIEETRATAATLSHTPSFVAYVVGPSPATLSYLRMKRTQAEAAGISMAFCELPPETTTEELIEKIQSATEDAIIVQLPLPDHMQLERVLDALPEEKDADVLSPHARAHGKMLHPIAASVDRILSEGGVSPKGKNVTVIGQGWLVGKPVASWLTEAGANVTVVTREEGNLETAVKEADIVVSGAGSPGIVTPTMIKEGAVVIDVGTSELGGSMLGDVDPEVATKASLFTPVPGGVGPIAVAYLMKNVVDLVRVQDLRN